MQRFGCVRRLSVKRWSFTLDLQLCRGQDRFLLHTSKLFSTSFDKKQTTKTGLVNHGWSLLWATCAYMYVPMCMPAHIYRGCKKYVHILLGVLLQVLVLHHIICGNRFQMEQSISLSLKMTVTFVEWQMSQWAAGILLFPSL